MEWISVKDRLPEIDEKCLVFYTIDDTDKKGKPTGIVYKYFEIAYIHMITLTGGNHKSVSWQNSGYDPVEPSHWMPLPEPPKQ